MGDYIVIAILLAVVGGIIASMVRNKREGKSPCGCDCSKCAKGCQSRMNHNENNLSS